MVVGTTPAPRGENRSAVAIQRRVTITGHVQGVFFRASLRDRARSEGVAGWAANRSDGAVEAVLEGEPEAVERVLAFAREGPRGAEVADVQVQEGEPEGLEGFQTR